MRITSPLGQVTGQPAHYSPDLLYAIDRAAGRLTCGLDHVVVARGVDLWTAYEMSWLGPRGVPEVAVMQFCVPATSGAIIESKSFKLYLNAFANTRFASSQAVVHTVGDDLYRATQTRWHITVHQGPDPQLQPRVMPGLCIDKTPLDNPTFVRDPNLLRTKKTSVQETLYSDLLKSNCPVTGQPDWASLHIKYSGPQLEPKGLLGYILSYRHHTDFHELCVEQIFSDILQICKPAQLSVYARYTRRGGLDINPFRSNFETAPEPMRTYRQ